MQQQQFKGLLDMIDGGGAGRAGELFEGGPFSQFLNMLGVKPRGYYDRLNEMRAANQPAPAIAPAPVMAPTVAATRPDIYGPGAVTTTTLPPMGQMSDEALISLIRHALERAPSAIGYGPR